MGFWENAKDTVKSLKPEEEVIDLQAKLSKLELSDISYLEGLMKERTYRGMELEQATTTYLKVKFIKQMLEQGDSNGETEIKDS
jgi:hypothetical protein|tara:strand:+ start:377 stop:628 length:252 start_codon:yes stop_codon:yes gene_type:complete